MRKQGTVVRWDAQRGFGFIRSAGSAGDIFFHKQDYRNGGLLREGLAVSFEEIHVGGKGPRAMAVQALSPVASPATRRDATTTRHGRALPVQAQGMRRNRGAPPPRDASAGGTLPAWMLIATWAALLAWAVLTGRIPAMIWPIALLLNLAAFFVYWLDKYAAQKQHWRIAEQNLHLFALLGGWPGAWAAQRVLRHKSSKASFLRVYWLTVIVHCTVLAGWVFKNEIQSLLLNR
ncbi:MAG: cold shock and DUF1294 domain-containing protein [Polaromonas sp.]|nr:cold shock and DUF1294 domain-containing protein [Polaromonas sp.]